MAFAACPECGARNLRSSRVRGFTERLRSLVGILPFRCRQCGARFTTLIWDVRSWRYARCPKCLRYELNTWSDHYYNAGGWVRFLVRLGASPYRCEGCRCNFASFRECKERFSWRKHRRAAAEGGKSDESAAS